MGEHHHSGISRRGLLLGGAAAAGTLLFDPLRMARNFFGEPARAAGEHVPFMVFNLNGGAALPGHFVPMSKDGKYLEYSSVLGLNPSGSGNIDTQFGTPMFVGSAYGIHTELIRILSAEARKRLQIVTLAHSAIADVANDMSALRLVVGMSPEKIYKNGFGTSNTPSGSSANTAIGASLQTKPLIVTSSRDIVSVFKDAGPLSKLSEAELNALLDNGIDLAALQMKKDFGNDKLSEDAAKTYAANAKNSRNRVIVDPKDNAEVRAVYGQTFSGADDVQAGIVFNVVNGNAPGGVIDIGGCDYHTSSDTPASVVAKDKEIGRAIARSVELAHRLKKPLVFQVITDGGCSPGLNYWGADDGSKNVSVMGFYHPDGAKKPKGEQYQIGHFNRSDRGIGADINTFIGNSPQRAGLVTFANYMAFSDRLADLENGLKLVGGNKVPVDKIKEHIVYG